MKLICAAVLVAALASAETAPNTLTAEEKKAGWLLLFDGKTMSNWVDPSQYNPPGDAWSIENGCLKSKSKPRYTEDLFTQRKFRDFELVFDWKISPGGNSGIKYRIQDHVFVLPRQSGEKFEPSVERSLLNRSATRPDRGQDYVIGFEYQLTDDTKNTDALSGRTHSAGALYDMVAPSKDASKPVGEWNHSRIVVKGNSVQHWMNGTKIVDSTFDSQAALDGIRRRWASAPHVLNLLANQPVKDCPISLQNHGDEAWFRNIKIRER
jgi:hypothetical protein